MKSKTKVLISLTLLIIFLFSNIFNSRFSKDIITNNNYLEFNEKDQVQIKQSGFWNLTGNPIYIDDLATGVGAHNWTWAENQPWCSGSGNWTEPYIIENVTIDGQGSGNCIEIENSDAYFIVRNCSLYNSSSSPNNAGIKLDNVDNGKIINNNCSDNYYGIKLWNCDNNTILGNNASNNNYGGILLSNSDDNTLSGNTASDNNYHGIILDSSNNNNLSENLMNFCGISLSGSLVEMASHCIDDTNRVNDKPVYYYANEIGLGSSNFTDAGQIILINCSNSIISGLNLLNGPKGIDLRYSNNNTISGNTVSNNTNIGIDLKYSNNNTLSGNTVSNINDYGIILTSSDNNTISGNTVNNTYSGILLFDGSDNNTISGNTASNNIYGIYLIWNCGNNTISGNTASNNDDYGIFLESSDNNKNFLNNFTNNGINAEDNGINNKWDNGTIGNYWDDYYGADANHDGIGDTPYIVPGTAGSRDNFPIWTDDNGITPVIFIDDSDPNKNWTFTASIYACCSGSGSWTDPYVIENATIDGQGSGSCIEIRNSDAYFIIRNCSLYNSGFSSSNAGIKLDNVDNGKIINNNCSDNDENGIYLRYSNNNTLSGNIANNNKNGISLNLYSDINTLSGNNASNNDVSGISIHDSNNNTISGNTANNNSHGIYLNECDNNTLSGNNASNNTHNGIQIHESNNNTLSGNNASNNIYGIYLYYSDNNTLSGNTADNNFYDGIRLENSDSNTLLGNTASDNNFNGILLSSGNNNTLSGNLMNFCGIHLSGSLVEMASHSIDDTNLVNNKPVYYYANEIALEPSNFTYAGYAGQIILINCNNSKISGINISDGSGIYLYYCVNNTLSGNNASNNNDYGISLLFSNNNTISGNNANNNMGGIYLWYSDNNTLSGNNASTNNYHGIVLVYSNNNTLSGNTASNNSFYGIVLYYCVNNTLSGNTASNNNVIGIYLENSDNNTISENNASDNNDYGIWLNSDCNNNKIFLNHFINNEINAEDNGTNNTWDNGFIGNYWSDYTGVDANHDGIGDTPYLVPGTAGSQDNFPICDAIAPVITIIFPLPDSIFGLDAPNYNIFINELYLDMIWYTLDGGITNYTITALTGMFNQLAWEALSEGSLTIRFYAKDIAGNIGSAAITVGKDISAPVITIIFPLPDSVFGLDAPNYNISIDELYLDTIWYTLDGGITNYTITALTGTFNHLAWNVLSEGNLTIRFYANDTAGNISFVDVEVIIEIPEDLPIISFGNYYILFTVITILSFIILEKRKKK